jgi:hypothetical protein
VLQASAISFPVFSFAPAMVSVPSVIEKVSASPAAVTATLGVLPVGPVKLTAIPLSASMPSLCVPLPWGSTKVTPVST